MGSALELMVLISRAQTETSVFELFVFICYRPFSSAFEERAVTVYNGDLMVTFFPLHLQPVARQARPEVLQLPNSLLDLFSTRADAMDRSS